jgi:hypothetical protein
MKINLKKVFILLSCLILGLVTILAKPNPPQPNNGKAPPPPPGLPIDEHMGFLVIIAIFFGLFVILNNLKKTKN